MLSTPHRIVYPSDVAPGRWIEHERAPMLVDEVRRTADGWTFYVRPAHRSTEGKRTTVELKAGDPVKLLPTDDERRDLARALNDKLAVMSLSVGGVMWQVDPAVEWRDVWPGISRVVDDEVVDCEIVDDG